MNINRLLSGAFLLVASSISYQAVALEITTSASGTMFGDSYGYTFTIEDTADSSVFSATLTNDSSSSLSDALIDALAFNMNPNLSLGSDFSIVNVSPTWTFSEGSGGIQFDYVGERTTQDTRLAPGDSLTFDFVFAVALPANPFDLWTTSAISSGAGIGGGEDFGQVAVSFQQLGIDGEGSDLLASNWTPTTSVPEPGTALLLGLGLLGLARARKHVA